MAQAKWTLEEVKEIHDVWAEERHSRARTAERLGVSHARVDRGLERAKEMLGLEIPERLRRSKKDVVAAAQKGYAPEFGLEREVPPGMVSRGPSILYDAEGNITAYWNKMRLEGRPPEDVVKIPGASFIAQTSTAYDQQGNVVLQWVKERPEEKAALAAVKEAVSAFLEPLPPLEDVTGPRDFDHDVIPWFQIGDAHIGMLAHEAETGANFDLKIAERELCAAFGVLFDECPARERCVINDLGDATHYENMSAQTEASRHQLDFDGRYPRMIRTYSRIMRFVIDRALRRFRYVDVIINQGNHSRVNDIWMAEMLTQVYAGNDRLNVLDNSSVFIPYRMGNTFVLTHHSDKTKPEDLTRVMSNDFRQDWGESEYRYVDVGHLHHKWSARESAGCTIEMWNTLAPQNKWSHDLGYRSMQSITRVDRSRTYGEVGRRTLPIKEIRNVIKKAYGAEAYIPPERRRVYSV